MKQRMKKLIKRVIGILLAVMTLSGGTVSAFAAANGTEGAGSAQLYALTVTTGATNGDGISMFAVGYIDKLGMERTEYILPFDGTYRDSLEMAARVTNTEYTAKKNSLKLLGYTGSDYSVNMPLRANTTNTFLAEFRYQIDTITRIDIITDVGETGTLVQWECASMALYKVSELKGLDYNGYYSDSYEIVFDGALLAASAMPEGQSTYTVRNRIGGEDTIVRLAPKSADFSMDDFYLNVYGDGRGNSASYRDVYVELDIADIYGGGIEAFTNLPSSGVSIKTLDSWYLPEVLTLKLYYLDEAGGGRTVTVPVVTSALAYALENQSLTLDSSSTLADFMGQGETVLLKLRLYNYGSMNTSDNIAANMVLSYDPDNAAAQCGLSETGAAAASHAAVINKIKSSNDSISFTGMYVYDAAGLSDSNFRASVQDGTILTYSAKNTPDYYYNAGTTTGVEIAPGVKSGYMLSVAGGGAMRPRSTTDNFMVIMKTSDSSLAETTSGLKLKLGYITEDNGTEQYTDNYDVSSLVSAYYGYWPAIDGSDAAYAVSMRKGQYIYCLVRLNGVNKFTSATLTLDGNDTWQCDEFYIYQVGDNLLGERHVIWQSVIRDNVNTDRMIYRKFNSVDFKSYYVQEAAEEETEEEDEGSIAIGPGNGSGSGSTSSGSGINIDGLDSIKQLVALEDTIVYLDAAHAKQRLDFESKTVEKDIEETDWRDTGKIRDMSYEDTRQDLGFTTRKKQYTIEVAVGTEKYESVNGDPGSSNYFYFQLEFENGNSSYVQANQQLAADGFIAGEKARFTVSTNHDYGALQAVHVIPDDSSSTANPYDKLKIDSITVSTVQEDNTHLEWVCQTNADNAWVGIDYVESGSSSSSITDKTRSAEDIITTYKVSSSTTSTAVLVAIQTGSYNMSDKGVLQASELYAEFNVTRLDGTAGQVTADVIQSLYDFSGESPILNPDAAGVDRKIYLTNTDSMFKSGQWNFFILELDDVMYINSVDLHVCSTAENITWTITDVMIARITADNGRYIDTESSTYMLDGETEYVTRADRTELGSKSGWANVLSPDTVKTYHIPFEKQSVILSKATTEAYEQNRTPISNNDYLNIAVFMKKDGTNYADCQVTGYVNYSNTYDTYYRTTPNLKRAEVSGQTVYYANGVGAKNLTAISSVFLAAKFGNDNDVALMDYIIIQRIRDGVVIENYYFAGGDADLTLGLTFYATSRPASGTQAADADYQVVTLMLGSDTSESTLTPELHDIAVSIRYTMTTGDESTVYQSPYIYLTDQNIMSIGPNRMLKLTFDQLYIREIKGIDVAVTGNEIYAYVDSASIGCYTYTGDQNSRSQTDENGIASASDVKNGYKCTSWYSIIAQQRLMAQSASFSVTDSVIGDYKAIVPMKVTFKTMEGSEARPITGLSEGAKLSMIILYTGTDGNGYVREFDNILDYAENVTVDSFTTGNTDVAAFMEQNMNDLTGIVLRPYDDDPDHTESWGVESITFSYGDGAQKNKVTLQINAVAEENSENGTKYAGLFVGIKEVPITVDVVSIGDETLATGAVQAVSGSEADKNPSVRISEADAAVRFTVSTSNTTQGVRVVAGRDSLMDSSDYLTVVSGSTIEFAPPTLNLDSEARYTIRVYANENPNSYAEFYVIVDAGLNYYSCSINTQEVLAGDPAVFNMTFSEAAGETSTVSVNVNDVIYTVELLAGQNTAVLTIPTDETASGALTARVISVTGNTSGKIREPISGTAVCNIRELKELLVTLSSAESSVEYGAEMSFTVTLSEAARRDMTLTIHVQKNAYDNVKTVTIPAGEFSASFTDNGDETNAAGYYTVTVTDVSGGGFDVVNYASTKATCRINEQGIKVIRVSLDGHEITGSAETVTISRSEAHVLSFTIDEPSEDAINILGCAYRPNSQVVHTYIRGTISAGETSADYSFDGESVISTFDEIRIKDFLVSIAGKSGSDYSMGCTEFVIKWED